MTTELVGKGPFEPGCRLLISLVLSVAGILFLHPSHASDRLARSGTMEALPLEIGKVNQARGAGGNASSLKRARARIILNNYFQKVASRRGEDDGEDEAKKIAMKIATFDDPLPEPYQYVKAVSMPGDPLTSGDVAQVYINNGKDGDRTIYFICTRAPYKEELTEDVILEKLRPELDITDSSSALVSREKGTLPVGEESMSYEICEFRKGDFKEIFYGVLVLQEKEKSIVITAVADQDERVLMDEVRKFSKAIRRF